MFDSRSEAESARERLTQSSIDAHNVRIVDQSSASSGSSSGSEDEGFWSSLKSTFMPEEDSHAYEEGMRRGGYLLCARVDEDRADEAVRLLDESDSVDFDSRQEEWRNEGWAGFGGRTDTGAFSGAGMGGSGLSSGMQAGAFGGSTAQQTDRTVDEERIPLVEEELRVGKREVSRGGARVRSYVRETPVHEQVSLREEHVSVERRPIDEKLGAADLQRGELFQDRNIEMTETAEEAVIAKDARVREEVVLRKTAEERVEQIDDTVRRTEVEVNEGMNEGGSSERSAFGSFGSGSGNATGAGAGATGFDSKREPEAESSGYTDRIDKSGV
jgi:uncharacterized protein (TIGR02271 family)